MPVETMTTVCLSGGGLFTVGNRHNPSDVDVGVGCIEAILADTRVMSHLTYLGQVTRALGAVACSTSRNCIQGHDISLILTGFVS